MSECDIVTDSSATESCESTARISQVLASNKANLSSWSEPLRDLFHRSCENLNENQKTSLCELLDKYKEEIFSSSPMDLGRTNVMHHSIPTESARPIKLPPRQTPRAFVEEEEKIIKDQLDAGLIRDSSSPWSAPLGFVKKKDGTVRPCVDYRRLNAVTIKDAYPLPRVHDCLDSLEGAKYFAAWILPKGFSKFR